MFSREVWKRAHYELPSALSNHERLRWVIKLRKPILHHIYERRQHCTDVNMSYFTITNKYYFLLPLGKVHVPRSIFFGPLMALLTGQLLEMAEHELRERGKWHAANGHRSDLSLSLLQPGHGSHTLPTELLGCPKLSNFVSFWVKHTQIFVYCVKAPLKVCCGIWHQDVSSRSFKSCKLRGGASVDWTCLTCTSHRCSIGLRSGKFGGQVNSSNSLGF